MVYKVLFVLGLLFEMTGQILLTNGIEWVYAQRPIDFTHWFLLLGVVFLMPQLGQFPKNIFSYIGIPLLMIGILSIIGMCVLDFIWWSQPNQEIRNEFAGHLSKFPSIWKPFITTGPTFLNMGLLTVSLGYFREKRIAVFTMVFVTCLLFWGKFIPHRLIYVYLLSALAYGILFFKNPINEHKTR
jgi:hypothetical protein